jgi:hypothetical protein
MLGVIDCVVINLSPECGPADVIGDPTTRGSVVVSADRKADGEGGDGAAVERQRAAVATDDRGGDREALTGSLADLFGRKERGEDPLADLDPGRRGAVRSTLRLRCPVVPAAVVDDRER